METFKLIFESPKYSTDMKGRALEMYILFQLSNPNVLKKGFTLPKCKQTNGVNDKGGETTLEYKIDQFIPHTFTGNIPVGVDWEKQMLLIPDSPNYPCADALLWNGKCLLAVQITVSPAKHGDISRKFHDMWRDALPAEKQEIKFLWIVPKGRAPNKYQKDPEPCPKFVCTLFELSNMGIFPLFEDLLLP